MDFIKDIIFPPLCLGCRNYLETKKEKSLSLCNNCKEELRPKINLLIHCPSCNKRVNNFKNCCSSYLLSSISSYENNTIRNLIHTLKYEKIKTAITPLKTVIENHLEAMTKVQKINFREWLIVPMPIHKDKFRKRGFNQAELITLAIQDSLKNIYRENFSQVSFITNNVITKKRKTENQVKMKNHLERHENIKDCFQLLNKKIIKNRNIILVDDVHTSGATMKEVIKELRKGNPRRIIGLVIAKG